MCIRLAVNVITEKPIIQRMYTSVYMDSYTEHSVILESVSGMNV